MSRADELLVWAAWLEGSGRENVAAALRAHTELIEAAEELLRLEPLQGANEPLPDDYWTRWDAAWERLRRAAGNG